MVSACLDGSPVVAHSLSQCSFNTFLGPTFNTLNQNCWVGKWEGHREFAFTSQLLFPFAHLWESLLRAVWRAEPQLLKLKGAEKLPLFKKKKKKQDLAGSSVKGIFPRLASEVSSQQKEGN